MEKPFAITLDVGTSRANKTGSWRTGAPSTRTGPPNHACPAGENIQGWLYEGEEGGDGYERAGARSWRTTRSRPSWAASATTLRDGLQPRPARRGGRDQLGRGLPGRRGDQAGLDGRAWRQPSGKRVLVVGAGPSGLSAAYHLTRLGHKVVINEAGPMAGGMMRFGIPKYRLPRDVLDAEVRRILDMGVERAEPQGHQHRGGDGRGRLRRRLPRSGRAHLQAGLHPGGRIRPHSPLVAAEHGGRAADAGPPRGRLRRRQHRHGRGPHAKRLGASDAIVVYRRNRERMPAHDFEVEEAEEEGVMMRWLSTIKEADEGKLTIEKMELDESGFPQPTGEFEELRGRLGRAGPRAGHRPVAARRRIRDRGRRRCRPGRAEHDDRPRGGVCGRRHGARRAHRHGRHRPRQEGGAPHQRLARAALRARPERAGDLRQAEHLVLLDAPRTERPKLDVVRRQGTFDEVVQSLDEDNALFEARRFLQDVLLVRQLLSARTTR